MQIGLSASDYIILFIGLAVVLTVSLMKVKVGNVRDALYAKPAVCYFGVMAVLFIAIIVFGAYGIGYDASSFIYSQF